MDDYNEIHDGVSAIKAATGYLKNQGVRIEIPDIHRYWEYGTAVQLLLNNYKNKLKDVDILDVGSGWGALLPTVSLLYNSNCTEYEPWDVCRNDRIKCNEVIK